MDAIVSAAIVLPSSSSERWQRWGSASRASASAETLSSEDLAWSGRSFGRHARRHASEFGPDVTDPSDRERYRELADEVIDGADAVAYNERAGQDGKCALCFRGDDLAIVNTETREIVSLMRALASSASLGPARIALSRDRHDRGGRQVAIRTNHGTFHTASLMLSLSRSDSFERRSLESTRFWRMDGGRMLWYRSGSTEPLRQIPPDALRCVDVETTGTSAELDEILQIAVVDGTGAARLCRLVRPACHESWPTAQALHGIAPEDVRDAPTFDEMLSEVVSAFEGAKLLIGYNLPFDLAFLAAAGASVDVRYRFDVMREFAPVLGRRRMGGGYRWQSLATCARYYDVRLARPHDALADARATLECYLRMLEDDGSNYARPGSVPYLTLARNR